MCWLQLRGERTVRRLLCGVSVPKNLTESPVCGGHRCSVPTATCQSKNGHEQWSGDQAAVGSLASDERAHPTAPTALSRGLVPARESREPVPRRNLPCEIEIKCERGGPLSPVGPFWSSLWMRVSLHGWVCSTWKKQQYCSAMHTAFRPGASISISLLMLVPPPAAHAPADSTPDKPHENNPSHAALGELGRIGRRDAVRSLRQYYTDESVRRAAYAAFSTAAAEAGGTSEFGWLGREALIAKYGNEMAAKMLADARQMRREKYGEEGVRVIARRAQVASAANEPYGAAGLSRKAGTAAALKRGSRVGYAGVRWQKKKRVPSREGPQDAEAEGFWRCAFSHRGTRYSVGSYATEEAAARAHDAFVLRHGLDRELHFPNVEMNPNSLPSSNSER